MCVRGGGQTLVLTDYWYGHWGHKPFCKLLGACLQPNPLAPTHMLHVPIRFEIKSVLKGSPFLVHRTDRSTTAP